MFDFGENIVLITGAAGGLGRGLCRYFIDAGATVIALDIDSASVKAMAGELGERCIPLVSDITDLVRLQNDLAVVTSQTGVVDVLVNNAGAAAAVSLSTMTAQDWQKDIDLNLTGSYNCVEVVKDAMLQRGAGAIVNIGSVNAFHTLGHPAYSAAKAGLISFTQALAVEYGPRGIRANIVCPGTVKTQAWEARAEKNPRVFEQLKKWYPLRNFAEPKDIAHAVAFLASDQARMITGVVLPVDGGLTAGNPVMSSELTLEPF